VTKLNLINSAVSIEHQLMTDRLKDTGS